MKATLDMQADYTIECSHLTKTYSSQRVLNDLSFNVPKGTVYGLLGPNGSGKTTFMRTAIGVARPDSGVVRILGKPIEQKSASSIGYMPEERGLYKQMRVIDVLVFMGRLKGISQPKQVATGWLEKLGLGDCSSRTVEALSKGMARRIQLIAAMISNPPLLILDEPFSGLDPVTSESIIELILSRKESGTTILLSTHEMEIAERVCDKILMLSAGQAILEGSVQSIRETYCQDRTILLKSPVPIETLSNFTGVERVVQEESYYSLTIDDHFQQAQFLAFLDQYGPISHYQHITPPLREVFLKLAQDQQ